MFRHTYSIVPMPAPLTDEGLSEVIGFILILGIITVLLSLYIVYVVPAEGRQNEILHMNIVSDQFNQYKLTIDSLIMSGQTNKAVYNTFTLGTEQISSSSGGFFVLPLLKPAGSTGAILINNRNDRVTISGEVLSRYPGVGNATISLGGTDPYLAILSGQPTHLYTNFTLTPSYITSLPNTTASPAMPNSGLYVTPLGSSTPPWRVWINHTPRVDYIGENRIRYDTDLTITVEKNGVLILQEMPIRKGISNTSPGNRYYVDLLDPAYGLGDYIQGPVTLQRITTSAYIENESLSTSYGFNTIPFIETRTIGSLEFRSGNRYFIDQDYYYQMGGVFLKQKDGMVNRITPPVSLSRHMDDVVRLSIDEIVIIGEGVLGGTSPVQIQSSISSIEKPIESPDGYPNAKWVSISINTDSEEASRMWNETFSRIRLTANKTPANVPLEWSSVSRDGERTTFFISGPDTTNTKYDIELDLRRVYVDTTIQRIGTILE
ncbi:MAG: hypothetical protein ACQXXC_08665 [Methanolinea tarda]